MMKKLNIAAILLLCVSTLIAQVSITTLKEYAEKGNAEAQRELGARYYFGKGVTKSLSEAATWFLRSADNGDNAGQFAIAYMYEKGEGLSQDSSKAFYWYLKSAQNGNVNGQVEAAYCYYRGYGCDIDYEKSANWYRQAAEKGNSAAQHSLGYLYMKGEGLEQNNANAVYWFRKSVAQENKSSYYNLATLLYNADGVAPDYAEAYRLFHILATEDDNDDAQYYLGMMYLEGKGVTQNDNEAFHWIERAAEQKHVDALYKAADMLEAGQGTSVDSARAQEYRDIADEIEWGWLYYLY